MPMNRVMNNTNHQPKWESHNQSHLCADWEPHTCQKWWMSSMQRDAEIGVAKAKPTWGAGNVKCSYASPKRRIASRITIVKRKRFAFQSFFKMICIFNLACTLLHEFSAHFLSFKFVYLFKLIRSICPLQWTCCKILNKIKFEKI